MRSGFPAKWYLVALLAGLYCSVTLAKLIFQLDPPLPGPAVAVYGLASGIYLLSAGMLSSTSRGLVVATLGGALAGISALGMVPMTNQAPLVVAAGLPLAGPGAVGLVIYAHSSVYLRPSLANRGLTVVAWAIVGALAALAYVVTIVLLRGQFHDTPTGTVMVGVACVVALVVAIGAVLRGRYVERRDDLDR